MSQFHNIFCRSADPFSRADLAVFVSESWYGDGDPRFEPGRDDVADWDRLTVTLPGVARPLLFLHDTRPEDVQEMVQEAVEKLGGKAQSVLDHLRETVQMIGVELSPTAMTEDAWEMLDIVQAKICRRLDGIVFAPDGVYDKDLQLIVAVSG
ncbi:MAG: hypothetical protein AUI14_02500 [Actinobacteria bacterium 13_2_20CM_2_71_6]|nr:MAG: hypothetical protein AUI14_02500 [Actinobacteria bacterium 13_2_20CM_2_71_6]